MRRIAADFDSALTLALPSADALRASLCTDDSPERLSVRGPAHTHTHTHTHTRPCFLDPALSVSFFQFTLDLHYIPQTAYCILHTAASQPRSLVRREGFRIAQPSNPVSHEARRKKHEARSSSVEEMARTMQTVSNSSRTVTRSYEQT
jgi:hypothetical protein